MLRTVRLLTLLLFLGLSPNLAKAYTYTWTGGLFNSSWTNAFNWSASSGAPALSYPGVNDDVVIPQIAIYIAGILNYPFIGTLESYTCKTLTLGGGVGVMLTVNGSLTVTGAVTAPNGNGNTDAMIYGSGLLSCASVTIGSSTIGSSATNTATLNSHIAALNVTGAITATTTGGSGRTNNAVFGVVNDSRNCTVTAASVNTTNTSAITGSSAIINIYNLAAYAATLKLTGATPVSIQSSTYGAIDFYNTGSGTSTVEFAATSGTQTIPTASTSGLNTSPALYQNLTFSGLGTKSAAAGNITINGNWSSASGAVSMLNATTIFQGTTQSLTDAGSNTGAGVLFGDVTFQGGNTKTINGTSTQTSAFSVAANKVLTTAASTTLAVGTYGKLTLNSDATGDASVAVIPTGCSITGNVSVQRYFKAGTVAANARNYRLLSVPVNANSILSNTGATAYAGLSYLSGSAGVYTGGPGGSANGFTVANATPTIYVYKETLAASNTTFNSGNFKGLTSISGNTVNPYNDAGTAAGGAVSLYAGNGFMLYYVGNNVANITSTTALNKQFRYNGTYIDPDAATSTATGTLNQGAVPVKIYWSGNTTLTNQRTGFNLVGNPYASAIDWDQFSTLSATAGIYGPGLSNSIYVFNYTSKNYGVYQAGTLGGMGTNNASRYIASGQGFFVKSTSSSASLTFNEAAKTTSQPFSFGSFYVLMGMPVQAAQQPQMLRIRLAKDTVDTDESLIVFEPGASSADDDKDVPRINGIGNVATLGTLSKSGTQLLAINHQNSIDSTTRVRLHVAMSGVASRDSLIISGFETLDPRYNAFLIDHYKNDSLQINLYGKYLFNIRPDSAASYGANRFELVFHKKADFNYRLLSFTGAKMPDGKIKLTWKTEREQNLTGFVLQKADGMLNYLPLYSAQSNGAGEYTYVDPLPAKGTNTYRLQQNDPFGKTLYSDPLNITFNSGTVDGLLVAYPNPVVTDLNVQINAPNVPAKVQLRVIDFTGHALIDKAVYSNNIQENLSRLTSGTYIIEVADTATQKVIGRTKISKP